jgi:hypothetical protein
MKTTNTVATGSAVLHSLLESPGWEPGDLDLFVQDRRLGEDGMVPWFDYLKGEGYGLSRQLGQGGQSFGQVCLVYVFARCVCLFYAVPYVQKR